MTTMLTWSGGFVRYLFDNFFFRLRFASARSVMHIAEVEQFGLPELTACPEQDHVRHRVSVTAVITLSCASDGIPLSNVASFDDIQIIK